MNLAYGQGGLKLEINIPPQHISAKSKGGLIIEGGVSSSEYGTCTVRMKPYVQGNCSVIPQNSDLLPLIGHLVTKSDNYLFGGDISCLSTLPHVVLHVRDARLELDEHTSWSEYHSVILI